MKLPKGITVHCIDCGAPISGKDHRRCTRCAARARIAIDKANGVVRRVRQAVRIEETYTVNPQTGCWDWFGPVSEAGYARCNINKKHTLVYKYLWEQINGPVPDGHELHHECLTFHCINPSHLKPLLCRHHRRRHCKLTAEDVATIRALRGKMMNKDIAVMFGLNNGHVSRIQRRLVWRED